MSILDYVQDLENGEVKEGEADIMPLGLSVADQVPDFDLLQTSDEDSDSDGDFGVLERISGLPRKKTAIKQTQKNSHNVQMKRKAQEVKEDNYFYNVFEPIVDENYPSEYSLKSLKSALSNVNDEHSAFFRFMLWEYKFLFEADSRFLGLREFLDNTDIHKTMEQSLQNRLFQACKTFGQTFKMVLAKETEDSRLKTAGLNAPAVFKQSWNFDFKRFKNIVRNHGPLLPQLCKYGGRPIFIEDKYCTADSSGFKDLGQYVVIDGQSWLQHTSDFKSATLKSVVEEAWYTKEDGWDKWQEEGPDYNEIPRKRECDTFQNTSYENYAELYDYTEWTECNTPKLQEEYVYAYFFQNTNENGIPAPSAMDVFWSIEWNILWLQKGRKYEYMEEFIQMKRAEVIMDKKFQFLKDIVKNMEEAPEGSTPRQKKEHKADLLKDYLMQNRHDRLHHKAREAGYEVDILPDPMRIRLRKFKDIATDMHVVPEYDPDFQEAGDDWAADLEKEAMDDDADAEEAELRQRETGASDYYFNPKEDEGEEYESESKKEDFTQRANIKDVMKNDRYEIDKIMYSDSEDSDEETIPAHVDIRTRVKIGMQMSRSAPRRVRRSPSPVPDTDADTDTDVNDRLASLIDMMIL